jgi:hypothetical protein
MDEYEVYEGKAFRICSRSRYLDFIEKSTIASDMIILDLLSTMELWR